MAINQNFPNTNYTWAQIVAFVDASGTGAIDFAVQRNPTTVFKFIRQNYNNQFTNYAPGTIATIPTMESMSKFLISKYNQLPTVAAQNHLIKNIMLSLPATAELHNWTTPVDGNANTTPAQIAAQLKTN